MSIPRLQPRLQVNVKSSLVLLFPSTNPSQVKCEAKLTTCSFPQNTRVPRRSAKRLARIKQHHLRPRPITIIATHRHRWRQRLEEEATPGREATFHRQPEEEAEVRGATMHRVYSRIHSSRINKVGNCRMWLRAQARGPTIPIPHPVNIINININNTSIKLNAVGQKSRARAVAMGARECLPGALEGIVTIQVQNGVQPLRRLRRVGRWRRAGARANIENIR